MNEVYYYPATVPILCGKLPAGFKTWTKIHVQPKGSIDCIQAIQLPAAGLSLGGCQGPGQGHVPAVPQLRLIHTSLFCSLFLKFFSRLASLQLSLQLPQTLSPLKVQPMAPVEVSKRAERLSTAVSGSKCFLLSAHWLQWTSFHATNRISRIKASLHLLVFGFPFPGLEKKINTVQEKFTPFFHF